MKLFWICWLCLLFSLAPSPAIISALAAAPHGRIFVLMVWDGLRPDLVTKAVTPNLYALEQAGVRFAHHHSVFPTVTMVNAAAIATGYPPGDAGIFADAMYLTPALKHLPVDPVKLKAIADPIGLERTANLIALNQPGMFDGKLIPMPGIGQRVMRADGYLAVLDKTGPTFLFDTDRFTGAGDGGTNSKAWLFMTDDIPVSAATVKRIGPLPDLRVTAVPFAARDSWYTDAVIAQALPAAIAASKAGHPALIVLWQRNPDITQHITGLGAQLALAALSNDDHNLGRLRSAIAADGVADRVDLMVVSDHGFATADKMVDIAGLLVAAGLKRSEKSDDLVVVGSQGATLLYLSPNAFPSDQARGSELQKIVDFAAAQSWCGPIFARDPAGGSQGVAKLAGVFDQRAFGLYDPLRSPDLIISMREYPDRSNRGLTGPDNPALMLGPQGQRTVKNASQPLLDPVPGTIDAIGSSARMTTGMGVHGAAGERELHNFCAAIGPDFRRRFVDMLPTGNLDVAPTIAKVLGLRSDFPPANATAGRVIAEALIGGVTKVRSQTSTVATRLTLSGTEITTSLRLTRVGHYRYLDGGDVRRRKLIDQRAQGISPRHNSRAAMIVSRVSTAPSMKRQSK
ncbi:MAG: alkaline phosphatase family protein [Candidatus Binataceae bacterium]|nr:alkaline phosphatase family protein [Candidatus Binataceae bacterium]